MSLQAFIAGAWVIPGAITVACVLFAARVPGNQLYSYTFPTMSARVMAMLAASLVAFLTWPDLFYRKRPRLALWLLGIYLVVGVLVACAMAYIVSLDARANMMVDMTAEVLGVSSGATLGMVLGMVIFTWPYHLVGVLL